MVVTKSAGTSLLRTADIDLFQVFLSIETVGFGPLRRSFHSHEVEEDVNRAEDETQNLNKGDDLKLVNEERRECPARA